MPVATQLSLFDDDDSLESSPTLASSSAKLRRRRQAKHAAESAMAAVAAPLFYEDGQPSAAAEATTVPLPKESAPTALHAPPPLTATRRFLDEEIALTPSRIVFDATVWELRADRGDFIHIRTGEIRDEDGFVFAAPDSDGLTESLNDWDIPQVVPRKAKDSLSSSRIAPGR